MFLFSLSLLSSKHKLTWLGVLFLCAAPSIWNTLPYEGRSSNPSSFYKSSLKTQFFSLTIWCICPLTHPHFTSHLSKPSFSVWPYDVCVCVLCVCVCMPLYTCLAVHLINRLCGSVPMAALVWLTLTCLVTSLLARWQKPQWGESGIWLFLSCQSQHCRM